MKEKEKSKEIERTKKAPFLVFTRAKRCFYKGSLEKELLIEIEIKGQKKDLGLSEEGIYIGDPSNIEHRYDKDGTYYFMDQIPNFGKVEVWLFGNEVRKYQSYEDFINKIASVI